MEKCVVANNHKANSLVGYRFELNECAYSIKSELYKLIIRQANGKAYCSIDVDSYYDCGIIIRRHFLLG